MNKYIYFFNIVSRHADLTQLNSVYQKNWELFYISVADHKNVSFPAVVWWFLLLADM